MHVPGTHANQPALAGLIDHETNNDKRMPRKKPGMAKTGIAAVTEVKR